jgi:hypothetical protein
VCGYVLLTHETVPEGDWYYILYEKLNGKCPGCSRPLPHVEVPYPFKEVAVKGNPAFMHKNPAAGIIRREFPKREGSSCFPWRLSRKE